MAKYYYCPLYLAPSMRQPGSRPTRSAYSPGLTDPTTLVTTSAVAALVAAGVDLDTYSIYNGYTPDPNTHPLGCKLPKQQPAFIGNGGTLVAGPQDLAVAFSVPNNINAFHDKWPGPGFANRQIFEPAIPPDGFVGANANNPLGLPADDVRPGWARTAILYIDTTRRMVIQAPDNFVDGPFIANGWVEKTVAEVNADYPLTIQSDFSFPPSPTPGQQTRPA